MIRLLFVPGVLTLLFTVELPYFAHSLRGFQLKHRSSRKISLSAGFGKNKSPSEAKTPLLKRKMTDSLSTRKIDEAAKSVAMEPTIHNHCPTLNLSQYPSYRYASFDPPVIEIDNFFSPELCDTYIKKTESDGYMIQSQTFSQYAQSTRTSTTWFFNYSIVPELLRGAHGLLGIPIVNFEEPQIARYELSQQFSWHYDAIPKSMLTESGNRIATLIVYLNDVKVGGATCFKTLNLQIKPKAGKALLFFPCFKDGRPDDRTEHAGQVAMDTKYIAQMWIHERPHTPTVPPGSSHAEGLEAVRLLS